MNRIALVLLVLLPILAFGQKQRVWIDTDIMIGKFRRDVDDGLALILAFADTNLQIEGISFVHGVDYASKVTDKLLLRYASDRNVPTFKGADDSTQLGIETDATRALIKALEEGPLTIFALGPMTNIATLIAQRPDLVANINAITYCAGRIPGKLFIPKGTDVKFPDYNFELDQEATAIVIKTEVPILLSGYDCSEELFLDKSDFKFLKKSTDKTDRWLFRQLRNWHGIWKTFFGSKNGFIPFDCSTVGALLYPNEFEIKKGMTLRMEVLENDSRYIVKSKTKPFLIAEDKMEGGNVSYCEATKGEFKKRLLRALGHPNYR